jgi:hypothetical protein
MIMDKDTPLRLVNSIGEENLEIRKFGEDPTEGIQPVKETDEVEVIQNSQGRWEKRTNKVNYNFKTNQESRTDEEAFYSQQVSDMEEMGAVSDNALLDAITQINAKKQEIIGIINVAVSIGCSGILTATDANPGGVIIGIGSDVYSDYAYTESFSGMNNYNAPGPFGELSKSELNSSSVGKGYETKYQINSEDGTLYGKFRTITGLSTTGASIATCVGYAASINALGEEIGELRTQIDNDLISSTNSIKKKKTESEMFVWSYRSTDTSLNEQKDSNQSIINTINSNVGLYTT